MIEIRTEFIPEVMNTVVFAAQSAGWQVLAHTDDTVLAALTTHNGDQHVVSINPIVNEFPARRSINDSATDATSQVATVLDWFIRTAIESAEQRGSGGEFAA